MSDNINEVRERLHAAAAQYAGPLNCSWLARDIRNLLDEHARLQAAHAEALKAMRQAVIALAHAQESDPAYQNAYGVLDAAIDAAKAVQPAPAIDLEQFRRFINACGHGAGTSPERKAEADRLLALIDGQKAAPRGPDQPDLCDLCRVREEVRSDAEGIPFCQECWDGWQAEEAKQQTTKGEGVGRE